MVKAFVLPSKSHAFSPLKWHFQHKITLFLRQKRVFPRLPAVQNLTSISLSTTYKNKARIAYLSTNQHLAANMRFSLNYVLTYCYNFYYFHIYMHSAAIVISFSTKTFKNYSLSILYIFSPIIMYYQEKLLPLH